MWRLKSSRLGKDLERPRNFLITWIGSLCFFFFHILSFSMIVKNFSFPNWPVSHMWILLFTFEVFTYAAFYFLYKGILHTVRDIRFGLFDIFLSRPVLPRFLTFFRSGGAHNLFSVTLGFIFLIGAINRFDIHTSVLSWSLFIVLLVSSLWMLHCLSVILVSLNFYWGYLPATQAAVFEIQEIFKYPSDIFRTLPIVSRLVLIPFTFFTSVPAAILLVKPLDVSLVVTYLITCTILTVSSHYIWNHALTHYSSGS